MISLISIHCSEGLSVSLKLSRSRLLDNPAFLQLFEIIFQSNLLNITKQIINQLDRDNTFIKLILSIIVFSTINYISKAQSTSINLLTIKQILNIQDIYVELVWIYLIYRYDYYPVVKCFSNVIRVIFISNEDIHQAQQIEICINMVDSLTQQTEQTLNIIN
ncbi:unnamed protein product [Rotaria sordida]|uniref:Uncharacterized protein n=2 Tax=Rotaria sordida TaxID=392033 RepID=A0A819LGE7_9BILA|nr:unnamed protein product [Rotaria sordida]